MEYFKYDEKGIKILVDKALGARKAREAAKKAREAARTVAPEKKNKALKLQSKLADCFSKNRKECEIYISEGDSASGGMKKVRNNEFQAILPLRGKVLNCEKASLEKMMANAEVRDMIKAFGLTLNVKTGKVTFDEKKLRYGKIIICADADIDGAHIQTLFYTFVFNFCPELIEKGYIYATNPPLFKVTIGKKYEFLKDEAELEEFKKRNVGKKYDVGRLKGLGEMNPDDLEESILHPEKRVLKRITMENKDSATMTFDNLMGTAVTFRKEFLKNHSHELEGVF